MRKETKGRVLCAVAVVLSCVTACATAAELSTRMKPGADGQGGVVAEIALNTSPEERVAGLQFDLLFNRDTVALGKVTAGPAAAAASKDVYCSAQRSGARVIVAGLNQNVLEDGVVAEVCLYASSAAEKTEPVALTGVVLSDPFGRRVPSRVVPNDENVGADSETEMIPELETARTGCFGGIALPERKRPGGFAVTVLFLMAATMLGLRAKGARRVSIGRQG